MFGAKYQWILAGKYADGWWRVARQETVTADTDAATGDGEIDKDAAAAASGDEHHCSKETLRLALNGYICADILILSSLQQPTIADMV